MRHWSCVRGRGCGGGGGWLVSVALFIRNREFPESRNLKEDMELWGSGTAGG